MYVHSMITEASAMVYFSYVMYTFLVMHIMHFAARVLQCMCRIQNMNQIHFTWSHERRLID